jgi:hypothetical protein
MLDERLPVALLVAFDGFSRDGVEVVVEDGRTLMCKWRATETHLTPLYVTRARDDGAMERINHLLTVGLLGGDGAIVQSTV